MEKTSGIYQSKETLLLIQEHQCLTQRNIEIETKIKQLQKIIDYFKSLQK